MIFFVFGLNWKYWCCLLSISPYFCIIYCPRLRKWQQLIHVVVIKYWWKLWNLMHCPIFVDFFDMIFYLLNKHIGILILLGFHKMGCNASSAATPPKSFYSAKSPAVDSMAQDSKRQIRKILQKDDISELAVIMAELGTYLIDFSITDQRGDLRTRSQVDAHSLVLPPWCWQLSRVSS